MHRNLPYFSILAVTCNAIHEACDAFVPPGNSVNAVVAVDSGVVISAGRFRDVSRRVKWKVLLVHDVLLSENVSLIAGRSYTRDT